MEFCGPNGTGKSGVVDAIEFCLTGDITRLSGQGTTGLSVKSHAPHVDYRMNPERANVTITASIPSLGKDITISRSVKNPKKTEIDPAEEDVIAVVNKLQVHPEFALSRREIVKYIITPPGKRSVDIQTLLRLDHVENLRKSFTTFANKCQSNAQEARRILRNAEIELETALNIEEPSSEQILQKVNERRRILDLSELTKLIPNVSFEHDEDQPDTTSELPVVNKSVAIADLEKLTTEAAKVEPNDLGSTSANSKGSA